MWRTSARRGCSFAITVALLLLVAPRPCAAADEPTDQSDLRRQVDMALAEVDRLFKAKDYAAAGERFAEALEAYYSASTADAKANRWLGPARGRLLKARRQLVANGVDVPSLVEKQDSRAKDKISFTGQVAPILISRCGRCHIQRSRGGLSMASFAALRRGSENGAVIVAGDSRASRLIDVLVNGIMPPNGNSPPSPDELAFISGWIDAGARFDGDDENAPLDPGAIATSPSRSPAPVARATGGESVSFAAAIAPVFIEQCGACHAGGQRRGGLSLASFANLLAGGGTGPVVEPTKPNDSLLIQKLNGVAPSGERMPLGKLPLTDEVIARFETWIAEGARFDGGSPDEPLTKLVSSRLGQSLAVDDLNARRWELAQKNFRLANPTDTPHRAETAHFVVVGNSAEERLAQIGRTAEELAARIGRVLQLAADGAPWRGRATLFVFNRRFEYAEFGRMVEGRETLPDAAGHWSYNGLEAYACVALPVEDDEALAAILAEPMAGLAIDSAASVPGWFARGSAAAIAARLNPKDDRVRRWDDELKQSPAAAADLAKLAEGQLGAAEADRLSYGFVKFLLSSSSRYGALWRQLREGTSFDKALGTAYGGDLEQLGTLWARRGASKRSPQ